MILKLVIILLLHNALNAENLIRQTNNGQIEGISEDKVNCWLGIPYAEKPIKDLRFKPPVPKSNWSNILKTATNPLLCMQNNVNNEDCLYLNVITPKISHNLPVLLWIHGGGFVAGSAIDYGLQDTLKKFAAVNDIIIVSIQYRLGVFGFFYMNTENAPGNMGLRDQSLAMKWVFENIYHFGGDKFKITLGGQSAGAKSTGMHLLSNISSNYFRNALMLSGSPNADTIITNKTEAISRNTNFLKLFNCSGSAVNLVDCVKNFNASYILKKSNEYKNQLSKSFFIGPNPLFTPVVDNFFLTDEPRNLLKRGEFKKCTIMTGSVQTEGKSYFKSSYQFSYFPRYPQEISSDAKGKINKQYLNAGEEAGGDFSYLCPSNLIARYYAENNSNVYNYLYTNNCCHCSELPFIFGGKNGTTEENIFSSKLVKYWSNFIKYNDPNVNTDFNWPLYDAKNKTYISLNKKKISIENKLKETECALWEELYSEAVNSTNQKIKISNVILL